MAKQVCENVHSGDTFEYLSSGQSYDMITMFSILEHMSRDEAMELLDIVYKSLRPGGRLILVTPNADSPFASHMRYGDATHEVIYNQGSLSFLLKVCGFTDCRAFETGPVPHGLVSGIRWFIWKAIAGLLSFYRLVEGGNSRGWIFTTEFILVADKE